MAEWLTFPEEDAAKLERRLPPSSPREAPPLAAAPETEASNAAAGATSAADAGRARPFVTLTFATSLDSSLSLAPGVRTALSGPESKAMTHYLRSRHDAILVGAGTAVADDPGLNCRLASAGLDRQPRPVVLDPAGRWALSERSKVLQLARAGLGLAPFIVTTAAHGPPPPDRRALLEAHGGKYIVLDHHHHHHHHRDGGDDGTGGMLDWGHILSALRDEGIRSVMVEGGGRVINTLLGPGGKGLVDSVIVTVAPTWLGQGGVVVSPDRAFGSDGEPTPALRLADVSWHTLGDDVVLCGHIQS